MLWRIVQCIVVTVGLLAQERPGPPTSGAGTSLEISGVAVDAVTGRPIGQARMKLEPTPKRDASTTILTGDDGRFIFPKLTPGRYRLTGQRRGYLAGSFNQHVNYSSSIVVGPDFNSKNLVFRLLPECAISGRISDEAGESVRGAEVDLFRTATGGEEQRIHFLGGALADQEGLYHFSHLPAGKYFVVVKAAPWYAQRPSLQQNSGGSNPTPDSGTNPEDQSWPSLDVVYPLTFYPGVTEESAATPISLSAGDRFVADISLQPVRALHVRIPTDEIGEAGNGKPISIELQSTALGAPLGSTQGHMLPSGDLEIEGLAPGHYQAQICKEGSCNGRPVATESAEVDVSSSGEISLEHETPTVHVNATVQIEPATALPLHGSLQLFCPATGDTAVEQLADAGELEFKHTIRPGRCELSLINSGSEFIKSVYVSGGALTGYSVEVKDPGILKLNVMIARGLGSVAGVALRDGKPVAGVMIVLAPPDPAHNRVLFRRSQSDSDGSFTINGVVPGKYTLLAIENGWDLEWLNPTVLKPYLGAGQVLQVEQDGKYDTKINVQ